jgi:predicted HTH transcriptional regulator
MIELNTLEDIELLSESEELECKLAAGRDGEGQLPEEFWPTYSAMANTDGGVVLLGVREKKGKFDLKGLSKPDRVHKQLVDLLQNPSKVSVNLLTRNSVEQIEIDGKLLLKITIPRASRVQRPVYLNGNPLKGNAYRRFHEADQRLDDEAVKLMLSEQQLDTLDNQVLPHFGIEDLSAETLQAYRQTHATLNPGHLWTSLTNAQFLKSVGAWKRNRETGDEGVTIAGLLMFGTFQSIQEVFPNYVLDYQERMDEAEGSRWSDRITLDGTWSGNLYDFYRKVYPKLIADLKIPFELKDGLRQSDSPVHVALREALANTLVHADYRERARVFIIKKKDGFAFMNPGLMRVPLEIALEGDEPDCRNRSLQAMFRFVNIGEQAGTGIPKILSGWEGQHWRRPSLREGREPNNRTVLEMQMLSLFPEVEINFLSLYLDVILGKNFENLSQTERLALVVAHTEGRLTHARLAELSTEHSSDLSKILRNLVKNGMLAISGSGKGASYHIEGTTTIGPDDVFGPSNLKRSYPNLSPSSPDLSPSSPDLKPSSPDLSPSSPDLVANRDKEGKLQSDYHEVPFIDDLNTLSPEIRSQLEKLAQVPRSKKKIPRTEMQQVILSLCVGHYITLANLAQLVNRGQESLRDAYLTPMCKSKELEMAFPDTPNHMRQAYTKASRA